MEAVLDARPTHVPARSRAWWAGTVLGALPILFLTFDTALKLAVERHAVEGTVGLGFDAALVRPLGLLEALCLGLFVVPRTAPLGAVLLTGYLGGAVAIHGRLGNPLLTHVLVPVFLGALCWASLYLRDSRVRALARPHHPSTEA